MTPAITYSCDYAWIGGDQAQPGVVIEVRDGTITDLRVGGTPPADAIHLAGLTLPGLANTHSHVFHRAIRGHTQSGAADFWRWREMMYRVAARLDPDTLYRLARATFVEMALAGITSVGEFFYLHHQPDGTPYGDPNEMGRSVIRAATDVGVRITLLDTCYLQSGVEGTPPQGAQVRFSDGSHQAWTDRVTALLESIDDDGHPTSLVRVGAAIHSVRAVPRPAMAPIAEFTRRRGLPLHLHVSEQPAENEACLERFGRTPVEVLYAEDVLGPATTAVHATHLDDHDIALLGSSRTAISMCCTTERDLADGVGPAIRLAAAGSPLCVGSDGHMMIDLLEEGRAIELNERLVSGVRGHLTARQIAMALTVDGMTAIGWPSAGLAVGSPADMTVIDLDSVRTAGSRSGDVLAHVLFSASAADVTDVFVAGRRIVADHRHTSTDDPGADLAAAIDAVVR